MLCSWNKQQEGYHLPVGILNLFQVNRTTSPQLTRSKFCIRLLPLVVAEKDNPA